MFFNYLINQNCICNFNPSVAAALVSSVRLVGRRISDRDIGESA
jgi:hypothetical protein